MHDLNMKLFYKTSFDVEGISDDTDVLWQIVCDIRAWMCAKWNKGDSAVPKNTELWTKLKYGTAQDSLDTKDRTVTFDSASLEEEPGHVLWACSIVENIRGKGFVAPREWRTEVGYEQTSDKGGTLSIVLSYGDAPGYLAPVQPDPGLSIPNLVWRILGDKKLACTIAGRPAARGAKRLEADDLDWFFAFLENPEREVPVVVASPGRDGETKVDPACIAEALGPSALTCWWDDIEVGAAMRKALPWDLRCLDGKVRIYASRPRFDIQGDARRHRFFTPKEIEELGSDEILAILRRALAADVLFYEDMLQVSRLRIRRKLHFQARRAEERVKEIEEGTRRAKDNAENEVIEAMAESERRERELEDDLLRSEEEKDKLQAEHRSLQARCDALEAALGQRGAGGGGLDELPDYPPSIPDLMQMYETVYKGQVVLTDRAWKSLRDCVTDYGIVWQAMHDLVHIALPLYRKGEGDIKKQFENQSRFGYSPNAGMQTRKDPKLMRGYEDTYRGRTINAEAHLSKGNKDSDSRSLRLYFAYDREDDCIVVSYCGGHLDNFTTRSVH